MSKYVDRVDMPIIGTGSLMLYKRPELDDEEANNSQCLHCDTQIRQVKIF